MNTTQTPETDALIDTFPKYQGNTSYGLKEIEELIDNNRKLERERDQLRKDNQTLRNAQKACEDCDAPTMEEVKHLRKVADAVGKLQAVRQNEDTVFQDLNEAEVEVMYAYNALPHVIAAKEANYQYEQTR